MNNTNNTNNTKDKIDSFFYFTDMLVERLANYSVYALIVYAVAKLVGFV